MEVDGVGGGVGGGMSGKSLGEVERLSEAWREMERPDEGEADIQGNQLKCLMVWYRHGERPGSSGWC